jgi:hypothetical protein
MISDEPAKFNHLQCTLVKYSDSIDELAEAVAWHNMVGVVRVLSEDTDALINEGPLDWAKKKLGWGKKDKEAEAEPSGDSEEVADAMSAADAQDDVPATMSAADTQGKWGHHPETTDKQRDWEEKYEVVYDWTVALLKRLSDPEKKALGNKPSWMYGEDNDYAKLLRALSNELYHRSKGLKPTYYSKGAKRPGKEGRPGRSINRGYEGDIIAQEI